jgi:hypothetical protein
MDENNLVHYQEEIIPYKEMIDQNVINFTPLSSGYIYEAVSRDKVRYKNEQLSTEVALKKGVYTMTIDFTSQVINHSPIEELDKFDSNTLLVSYSPETPYYQDCSPCESITEDMFRSRIEDGIITINYDPTCSCDWYIYSSRKIPVEAQEELRVEFEAVSENIEKRHSKLVYVDQFDHVVETQFIFEIEEDKKSKWHRYEQLDIVPESAAYVLLQFWARGDHEKEGYLKVKNLSLEKYDEYVVLDNVILEEISS